MRKHIKTLREKYRNLKRWERVTAVLLVVAVIALVVISQQKPENPFLAENESPKEVILRSVADLSLDTKPLDLIGMVRSESQVDIRTEASGNIVRVSASEGQFVSRGQTLAEIENSTQRATVAQAQSAVDAQVAQLNSLKESVTSSGDTVAVVNARRTLYSTGLVAEPESDNSALTPPLISGVYNGSEEGIYDFRIRQGSQIFEYEFFLKGLEGIRKTEIINHELKSTSFGTYGLNITFTNPGNLNDYVESRWIVRIPNTKNPAYSANLAAYNSALDAQRGLQDQIVSQEAQVESAKSNLAVAQAGLEKTIIRSPIFGTLNNLSIELGDFVSSFQSVAEVANENQLEVRTYITENDKASIEVGLPVRVSGKYEGTISSIAPAVDSATKKIEVSISVSQEAELINGQSVSISISRKDDSEIQELEQIYIPLSALKVTAEGVVVFSVGSGGVVKKHVVSEGPLVGDKVLITSGLTPEMQIITDVRGISVGDVVKVIN